MQVKYKNFLVADSRTTIQLNQSLNSIKSIQYLIPNPLLFYKPVTAAGHSGMQPEEIGTRG